MFRNLILDWSGTLVDDLEAVVHATNAVLRAYGRPVLSSQEFRREFELPVARFYRRLLPGRELPDIDAVYHEHFARSREAIQLLPHARGFLGFCRATGRRLFLLSTMNAVHFEAQSVCLGVRDLFEAVYPAATDKAARLGEVLHEHRLPATETAFIGDMVHDIEAARSAGVTAVAVLTGFDGVEKLGAAGPDLIVRDLGVLQHVMNPGECCRRELIQISDLEVTTRIGATTAEQETPQKLWLDVALEIERPFAALEDALERTVDYAAVAEAAADFARTHRCRLIETFAAELAELVTGQFPVRRVEITVKKVVLPNARQVFVRTRHTRR